MRTYSNENNFDLHENGREGGTHFHMNVLKQRQKVTRKWPINMYDLLNIWLSKRSR